MMRRSLTLLLAPAFLLLALGAAALGRPILLEGPLEPTFRGSVDPKVLPAGERAPVSLRFAARFRMRDGSHPPALKELRLRADRSLRLALGDVPACRGDGLRSPVHGEDLFKGCKDSIVGSGRMNVEILFPEQAPIRLNDEVVAYKLNAKGRTATVALHTSITVPTPADIVTVMEVKPIDKGRYGIEAVATVPKIVGGAGSITHLALRFRKGTFTATCPLDRRLQLGLAGRFASGSVFASTTLSPCRIL
jgi:hypothetical protein